MLAAVAVDEVRRRHVFDLPPLNITVTEHRTDVNPWPRCDAKTVGSFPEGIVAPTQYGPHLLGPAMYPQPFQMLPGERIREFFEALWGHAPSGRPIVDMHRPRWRRGTANPITWRPTAMSATTPSMKLREIHLVVKNSRHDIAKS